MSLLIFNWDEDEAGNTGWLAKGYPNFNVTQAGNFGHDCVEHFPRGIKHGAIADELMALGARLRLRVDSGWWWSQRFLANPSESFGYELDYLLRAIRHGEQQEPANIANILLDECMDAEIDASIDIAVARANRELEFDGEWTDQGIGPYTADSPLLQNMGAWMRLGYRANEARFRGAYAIDVMDLQQQIDEEAAKPKYRGGDYGDQLHVRIHEKNMEYEIKLIRPGREDW